MERGEREGERDGEGGRESEGGGRETLSSIAL